jgi:hypothetical protein
VAPFVKKRIGGGENFFYIPVVFSGRVNIGAAVSGRKLLSPTQEVEYSDVSVRGRGDALCIGFHIWSSNRGPARCALGTGVTGRF